MLVDLKVGESEACTYFRGFFFGPGFPRTLGVRSASAAVRLPFLLTASVGGGIKAEAPAALGAGVLAFDPGTLASGDDADVAATGVGAAEGSSLMTAGLGVASCGKACRALGESLRLTILLLADLRLPPAAADVDGFAADEAMATMWCEGGWSGR